MRVVRVAAIETLTELAATDPRVVLLTGDLGFGVVERFAQRFPERFLNVGVAEHSLIGVATGLAEAGYRPFAFSIAPFAALRPFEFIRNGPVLQHRPVTILGVGGGFEYGCAGPTHFGLEDLGAMRLLDGLTVLAPADAQQARTAIRLVLAGRAPAYVRLGKDETARVPGLEGRLRLGGVEVVRTGRDLLLLVAGGLAPQAVAAADALESRGLRVTLAVAACLAPAPGDELAALLAAHPLCATLEAHVRTGGLGELVAGVIAERGIACRWLPLHAHGERLGPVGSAAWLHATQGLTADAVTAAAIAARAQPRAQPRGASAPAAARSEGGSC